MKLNHAPPRPQREARQENGNLFIRYALLAGTLSAGLIASPERSNAEQPRREQCSASVERGTIASYTSTTRRGRIINTPLFDRNRYLQLTLPNTYMEQVGQAALTRPEAGRSSFISGIVQSNVELGLAATRTRTRATFGCAPLAEPATASPQPAAQPAAGTQQPSATTAPPPATAPPSPPPAPSPAPSETAPPAEDGGAVPDGSPQQRRRVIQPGAPSGKSGAAPKQPVQSQATAPMPPVRKGGSGTEKDPYVIEVPVPSKSGPGTVLQRQTFPYVYHSETTSAKIYVALRFVAAAGSSRTTKKMLVKNIVPLAVGMMREALRAGGVNESPLSARVETSVGQIIDRVKDLAPEVKAYVTDA